MARLLLILWFALAPAQAIVWHSDKKAPPQSKPEGAMRNIARVHFTKARVFGGCGIQLNDRWILIAKHEVKIFKAGSLQVRIGKKRLAVKRIVRHPDEKVDLALLEVDLDKLFALTKLNVVSVIENKSAVSLPGRPIPVGYQVEAPDDRILRAAGN